MRLSNPADVGAAIRSRRMALGLDQGALAARVGATRQWVISVEQGHPRAALGLVLRTLTALNLTLDANPQSAARSSIATPDIDAIINAAKKSDR